MLKSPLLNTNIHKKIKAPPFIRSSFDFLLSLNDRLLKRLLLLQQRLVVYHQVKNKPQALCRFSAKYHTV